MGEAVWICMEFDIVPMFVQILLEFRGKEPIDSDRADQGGYWGM